MLVKSMRRLTCGRNIQKIRHLFLRDNVSGPLGFALSHSSSNCSSTCEDVALVHWLSTLPLRFAEFSESPITWTHPRVTCSPKNSDMLKFRTLKKCRGLNCPVLPMRKMPRVPMDLEADACDAHETRRGSAR